MEAIQINVSVELNMSQDTKDFISSLFKPNLQGTLLAPAKQVSAPAKPAPAPAPEKPATPTPAKPTATAPAPASVSTSITIEQVRQALANKINGHREEIKNKLNSLGAPSVTKLDPAKYSEMFTFLNSLS
jgi:hypothetical protein